MESVNPHTGMIIRSYVSHQWVRVNESLHAADLAFQSWRKTTFTERAVLMNKAASILRSRKTELAHLMAEEMGKVVRDGEAEIEKCATCCEYYAEHAAIMLADRVVPSDAKESAVVFDPLGVVLAVMPWNFPFWQVFRFAAPSLMAGNVGVLKHASNVSGCALAIHDIFDQAGFPVGTFTTVLISGSEVKKVIRHPLVRAVTLTGSTPAGRSVASIAGSELKKTVLELGGSDAYVVLEDADIELAVEMCVKSRLINVGQSCIAAKRFIIVKPLYADFEKLFTEKFKNIRSGDPKNRSSDMGPMARKDLRDEVHSQVQKSIAEGAQLLIGGQIPAGPGAHYPATVLGGVKPGMTAFDEEIFGPVAALIEANDERHAIELANNSEFGLGAAIFSRDLIKAKSLAREIEAGSVFINTLVKSDSRLPFGGIKLSGYGRELSWFGIQEFVNVKTVSL